MFKIENGISDGQILQRDKCDLSKTSLTVSSDLSGQLFVTVKKGTNVVNDWDRKKVLDINKSSCTFDLEGIPVGGAYSLEFLFISENDTEKQKIEFNDIYVGDVWLLAGQSNMQGYGELDFALSYLPEVRAYYMNDAWGDAKDPIHNLHEASHPVHSYLCGGFLPEKSSIHGVGPGVAFGQKMFEMTGVPQGLIACAHGGTSIKDWDPSLVRTPGQSLYAAMLNRFHLNGSNVAGLLWYHGCVDAGLSSFNNYTAEVIRLVNNIRKDTGITKLPVAIAQLASSHFDSIDSVISEDLTMYRRWNSVQEQQRTLVEKIENVTVVPTVDLSLIDSMHLSGDSQNRLGARLADAMSRLAYGSDFGIEPISLKRVEFLENPLNGCYDIEVEFSNIAGKLTSNGNPSGFSILHRNGNLCDVIYRVKLEGKSAIIQTSLPIGRDYDVDLFYGFGRNVYCNIADWIDRSLPAFGPINIKNRIDKFKVIIAQNSNRNSSIFSKMSQ